MSLPLCIAGTLAFCTSLCVVRAAKNSKAVFLHADRRLSAGKAEHYLKWSMSSMFERLTDTGSDPCSTLGNAAERQTAQHLHPGRHHCDIRSDPLWSQHYFRTTTANALALIPCCVLWVFISTDTKNGSKSKMSTNAQLVSVLR